MAGAFPADPAARYAVRLFFSDYSNPAPGMRAFDLTVAGKLALSDFDIVGASMGRLVGVVRTFLVRSEPTQRNNAELPCTRQGTQFQCHHLCSATNMQGTLMAKRSAQRHNSQHAGAAICGWPDCPRVFRSAGSA